MGNWINRNLYQVMYTSAWFIIGFFTTLLLEHLISGEYDRAALDVFLIGLNLFNQRNLWGRYN